MSTWSNSWPFCAPAGHTHTHAQHSTSHEPSLEPWRAWNTLRANTHTQSARTWVVVIHQLDLHGRLVPLVHLLLGVDLLTGSLEGHQVVHPLADTTEDADTHIHNNKTSTKA